jgi:hypothetical protein
MGEVRPYGPDMALPCPACGENVPIVLRGTEAFCTACGKRRMPMANEILNLKGKTAKVSGSAARVLGLIVWIFGFFLALLLGVTLQAFLPMPWIGWAVGAPIAFVTLLLGAFLFFGGRTLGKIGDASATQAQRKAIRGIARLKDGVVRARDVALHLHIPESRADALLTELAARPEEDVGIEIDPQGVVLYLFDNPEARRWRVRVEQGGHDPDEFAAGVAEIQLPAANRERDEREA